MCYERQRLKFGDLRGRGKTVDEALPSWRTQEAVSQGRRSASLETPRFMVRDTNHPRKTFLNDIINSFIRRQTERQMPAETPCPTVFLSHASIWVPTLLRSSPSTLFEF